MSDSKLVYMANQIATNFRSMGEQDAIAATAEHIRLFWSPSMRKEIEVLRNAPDVALGEVARKALERIASEKVR
jgi:formate dehydrogenase subunit delta